MSLINKMLQDLDARADKPGAAPLPGDVRPVLAASARISRNVGGRARRSAVWKRALLLS